MIYIYLRSMSTPSITTTSSPTPTLIPTSKPTLTTTTSSVWVFTS
jgi:hypothetical protein